MAVPQTATMETMHDADTAPCWPNLMAAQISNGNRTYARLNGPKGMLADRRKTDRLAATRITPSATASSVRRLGGSRECEVHTRIGGATTNAPIVSPSHQERHASITCGRGIIPAK